MIKFLVPDLDKKIDSQVGDDVLAALIETGVDAFDNHDRMHLDYLFATISLNQVYYLIYSRECSG